MRTILPIFALLLCFACTTPEQDQPLISVVTDDIDHFWEAYDLIQTTADTALQLHYLDSLFLQRGTPGLEAIREARNYSAEEYLAVINNRPKFWNSIRENTLRAKDLAAELSKGAAKLQALYPAFRPAQVYFTVGAFRTNGTTLDSLVLIGSELALTDANAIVTEFPQEEHADRSTFFSSNPIDGVVFLNVHELVHTQQKEMVHNLLSEVIYEGIAEFVAVKAMGIPSVAPAIAYGQEHYEAVRDQFEHEMFYVVNRSNWLWSSRPNRFGVRDPGYYIGYEMAERYYKAATDKAAAIRYLVDLDYTDEAMMSDFVEGTQFFTAPLDTLYTRFEAKRPTVTGLLPFANHSENVDPNIKQLTFEFSRPLNGHNTGIDYGPLGGDYFPPISRTNRIWSEEGRRWTIEVDLEPGKHYQFMLDNNFRTADVIPLKPFVVEFKTREE